MPSPFLRTFIAVSAVVVASSLLLAVSLVQSAPHGEVEEVTADVASSPSASSSPYWFEFFAWDDNTCSKGALGSAAVKINECQPAPALFNTSWAWYRVTMTDPMTNTYAIDAWFEDKCTGEPDNWLVGGSGTACSTSDQEWITGFIFHSPIIAPLTITWYSAFAPHCHCSDIPHNLPPEVEGIVPNTCHDGIHYLTLFDNGTFTLNLYTADHCQHPQLAHNLTGLLGECVDSPDCEWSPVMVTKTQPTALALAHSHSHSHRQPSTYLRERVVLKQNNRKAAGKAATVASSSPSSIDL